MERLVKFAYYAAIAKIAANGNKRLRIHGMTPEIQSLMEKLGYKVTRVEDSN